MSRSFVKISETIINRASASFGQAVYNGGQWSSVQLGFQIVLVVAGDIEIRVKDRTCAVPTGQVLRSFPNRKEAFIFSPQHETRCIWCTIWPQLVPAAMREQLLAADEIIPISKTLRGLIDLGLDLMSSPHMQVRRRLEHEQGFFQNVEWGLSQHESLDQLTLQIGLSTLQCFLADHAVEKGKRVYREPPPLEKALQHIHEHFSDAFTLPVLAEKAGVTPNHLIKLFRQHAGVSPMEYLWQVRLDRGMGLLRQTGLSISEIAYQTGFKSPFHFTRRFCERYGKSPRAFRRDGWKNHPTINAHS